MVEQERDRQTQWGREGGRGGEKEAVGEGGEAMIAVLLAHEFLKGSYDWQSHAAGSCVHTSCCTAVDTHTQAGIHTHVDYLLSPNQSGCMNAILYVLKYNFEDKKKRKE